jgi:hypothetical protein
MENQVQILEDLLARVQRNRLKMDTASQGHRRWDDVVGKSAAAAVEVQERDMGVSVSGGSDVIDLVNPTSVPPSAVAYKSDEIPTRQSAAIAPDVDNRMTNEDDFSSVAPVSVAPASGVNSQGPEQDDFSSVAPVSVAPATSADTADDDIAAELPHSMVPVDVTAGSRNDLSSVSHDSAEKIRSSVPLRAAEVEADTLDVVPPSMLPVSEPQMASGETSSAVDEDELELENTDTASMHPGIPHGTPSMEALHAVSTADTPDTVSPESAETRSFESTATASGDIVHVSQKLPEPKSWAISAVLHRAWSLGKPE